MKGHFDFNCVNRIKGEKCSEFNSSIFKEVYQDAHELVQDVIKRNEEYCTIDELDKFCNENQIYNVISFLGERGMGKSSAMLSFAYYLKKYSMLKLPEESEYYLNVCENIDFHVLSKIDAAMMVKGESLFDIVLAKMWDEFERSVNGKSAVVETVNLIKEKFSAVKARYAEYRKVMNGEKKLQTSTQLTELHELSQSLNLRKSFADLVRDFLKNWEIDSAQSTYLVIIIDDLDMVKDDIYNKLEQIRMFFMIPNVIVLITADIDRLSLDLSGVFSRQMLCEFNVQDNEMKRVREYADNYLAKVLPRNMRVYMPFFDGMDGNKILLGYEECLKSVYEEKPKEEFGESKYTLSVLAKYMDILMYPYAYIHSTKQKSLRNIVNGISELVQICGEPDNYSKLYQWVRKEVSISSHRIETEELRDFMRKLLRVQEKRINFYLANWRFDTDKVASDTEGFVEENEPGYGAVLCKILTWQQKYYQDNEFMRLLIWVYSIQISNAVKDKRDIEDIFIKHDIFGSVFKGISRNIEGERNYNSLFSLEFLKEVDVDDMLEKNKQRIYNNFYLLLLCDADRALKKMEESDRQEREIGGEDDLSFALEQQNKQKEKKIMVYLAIDEEMCSISIDNLFRNMLRLDELWEKYFRQVYCWGIKGVKTEQEEKIKFANDKFEEMNKKISIYREWKEKHVINDMNDILPIQNVGVMVEIARKFKKTFKKSEAENEQNMGRFIKKIFEIIGETYQKVEEYYHIKSMASPSLKYSHKINELYSIINFEEVPDILFNNLIIEGYEVRDTSI